MLDTLGKFPPIEKVTADVVLTITDGPDPSDVFCNIQFKATQKQVPVPNVPSFDYNLSARGNIFEATISGSRLISSGSYQGDYQFNFTSDLMMGQWNQENRYKSDPDSIKLVRKTSIPSQQ